MFGVIKGHKEIIKENKAIKKSNPYIYYRELPNNFGIGVASLLFDSTMENYKDIVAVILDLCAKKYLKLEKQDNKYNIQVLKAIDNGLLSNEKYILSLIINNDIKSINYKEWYNYCLNDGISLGLYYPQEVHVKQQEILPEQKVKKRRKIHLGICIIFGILTFAVSASGSLFAAVLMGLTIFVFLYLLLLIPFSIINAISGFRNIAKQTKNINYKNIRENTLKKTAKGVEELHKLHSLKAFIKDFGYFANKRPEEIVLWDRYLSYAQVFGLTDEIMSTGYKELVSNASFKIDNIDDVRLDLIYIN